MPQFFITCLLTASPIMEVEQHAFDVIVGARCLGIDFTVHEGEWIRPAISNGIVHAARHLYSGDIDSQQIAEQVFEFLRRHPSVTDAHLCCSDRGVLKAFRTT